MQAIVKWNRNGGKRGHSKPMNILDAVQVAKDGCDGWGKGTHWIEPVAKDAARARR